jgi:hypothetical protein
MITWDVQWVSEADSPRISAQVKSSSRLASNLI